VVGKASAVKCNFFDSSRFCLLSNALADHGSCRFVAAFAADPPAGGEGQVRLADTGEMARVRLMRQYAAASGRECRELRVSRRGGEQNRLYCRAGTGWIEARPLLSQPVVQQ
jgi:hypothetical protein